MPTNLHYKNDLPDIQISSCPSKQGKKYRFNPLAEALVIGVSMLIAILSTTYFIYQHAVNAQKGEFQDGILRVANTISKYVDGDLHSSFVSRDQESTDNYLRALEPLKKALDGDLIAFVYTITLKNGKVHFILDPTPEGDSDGDGVDDKSHIMDEYPEATPEMLQALNEQKAIVTVQSCSLMQMAPDAQICCAIKPDGTLPATAACGDAPPARPSMLIMLTWKSRVSTSRTCTAPET